MYDKMVKNNGWPKSNNTNNYNQMHKGIFFSFIHVWKPKH